MQNFIEFNVLSPNIPCNIQSHKQGLMLPLVNDFIFLPGAAVIDLTWGNSKWKKQAKINGGI